MLSTVRRIAGGLSAIAAAALAIATPTAAGASAVQGCSGSVCVDVSANGGPGLLGRGEQTSLGFDIHLSGGSANLAAVLHDTAGLIPDASAVRFDGAALPAGAVTVSGTDVTVDLSSVNPVTSASNHTLTYSATMSSSATTDQSAHATVTFDDALGDAPATSTSDDYTVALNRPDFAVYGARANGKLTPGGLIDAALSVYGPASYPSELTFTVPSGFTVDHVTYGNDPTLTTCVTSSSTVTCPGGDFSRGPLVDFYVHADRSTPIGTTANISVDVEPVGITDATPSDNTALIPVTVVGTAALKVTLTDGRGNTTLPNGRTAGRLPIGLDTKLTVTVTNQGPNPSTDTDALITVEENPGDYRVTFPAALGPKPQTGNSFPQADWKIGHLAVGQTVTGTFTIRALKKSQNAVLVNMSETERNPLECGDSPHACLGAAALPLLAVQPTAADRGTGSGTGSEGASGSGTVSGSGGLAATGARATVPAAIGGGALVLGVGLLFAGRRRRLG